MVNIWSYFPLPAIRSARAEAAPRKEPPYSAQLQELCRVAGEYLKPAEVNELRRAYAFGAEAHAEQRRVSGEPYIEHPLAVATVLAGMHLDPETLIAAVLHDVLEDTAVDKPRLKREFGEEVAGLVDGVSKLTQMEFGSYAEAQAENFRKMLLAMTHDIRVILVKLADRLHNMRTVGVLDPERRRRIARETLDIYTPIAQRLGINSIRVELEDLGFAALYPQRYRVLAASVKKVRGNHKALVEEVKTAVTRRLRHEKVPAQVVGREKNLYDVYRKMAAKHLPFSEVRDLYACRIIVDDVDTAYRVLGVVHDLYKPLPGRFKDYIAIPKANGYQSLHTVLFGPKGAPVEVQIRTKDMDAVAEHGIAAHWRYKTGQGASTAQKRTRDWLRRILELQGQAGNSEEFLENVKIDLFPDEIYVFTPKGDIFKLQREATAVDLAYAVHTDIGNRCVAARIDGRMMPLRSVLSNGQTVEIITAPGASPSPTWLSFAVTAKARANIRHFLKGLERDEAQKLGRRLLNRELQRFSVQLDRVPADRMQATLKDFKLTSPAGLLEEIGLGQRMAIIVARHLLPSEDEPARIGGSASPLEIKGTEGMVVSFPKCCYPIPGDSILGYVSSGRGIVIHRQSCKNVAEFRNHPEKWVDAEWGHEVARDFPVAIRIDALNQRGALATIAATIADHDADIELVDTSDSDGSHSSLSMVIAVRGRKHLADIMRALRGLRPVARVVRVKG